MWKIIVNEGETKYGPDWTWIDTHARHGGLSKLASSGVYVPPTLAQKIEEIKDRLPLNKVAFYNRALPAYESFGSNRNGDAFERHWLEKKHDTFVKNANYFKHHQNKDPALSRGKPVASAFNQKTDMVDLVIVADRDKCQEQIEALESGRRVPTSMGCKVAADQCSICGHLAKTRDQYCGHVSKTASAPYGMNQILPDGTKCFVFNPDPNFFDISDVVIGAAPESETLLKVASLAGQVSGAELAELYGLGKNVEAAIIKKIPGEIGGSPIFRRGIRQLSQCESDIPSPVLEAVVKEAGFGGLLRNTSVLGIVLKPNEFAKAAGIEPFAAPTLEEIMATESMPQKILAMSPSPRALEILAPYQEKRSAYMPALLNRLPGLRVKVASTPVWGDDYRGRVMYAAYRHALLDQDHDADGEYWAVKCAGVAMSTTCTRDYLASAYLGDNKMLDRLTKIAEPHCVVSAVEGSMAEKLGPEVLDRFAVETIRGKQRRQGHE